MDGLGRGAGLIFRNPILRLGAEQMKVELDKKSLFALASDTRLEILKSLQPMRRTISQLSEALNIDKAAIHRHLKKMEEGGLVKRYEDHGFVYYGLSWKARDLLSPNENTRIVVLLSTTTACLVAAAFFVAVALTATETAPILIPRGIPPGDAVYDRSEYLGTAHDNPFLWILPLVAFGLSAVFVLKATMGRLRRPKQKIDPGVESSQVERPVPED